MRTVLKNTNKDLISKSSILVYYRSYSLFDYQIRAERGYTQQSSVLLIISSFSESSKQFYLGAIESYTSRMQFLQAAHHVRLGHILHRVHIFPQLRSCIFTLTILLIGSEKRKLSITFFVRGFYAFNDSSQASSKIFKNKILPMITYKLQVSSSSWSFSCSSDTGQIWGDESVWFRHRLFSFFHTTNKPDTGIPLLQIF